MSIFLLMKRKYLFLKNVVIKYLKIFLQNQNLLVNYNDQTIDHY